MENKIRMDAVKFLGRWRRNRRRHCHSTRMDGVLFEQPYLEIRNLTSNEKGSLSYSGEGQSGVPPLEKMDL